MTFAIVLTTTLLTAWTPYVDYNVVCILCTTVIAHEFYDIVQCYEHYYINLIL